LEALQIRGSHFSKYWLQPLTIEDRLYSFPLDRLDGLTEASSRIHRSQILIEQTIMY
jgi:hypothetical protein